jgi:cytochrome c-type biogenesis protein CcmH/NrfF
LADETPGKFGVRQMSTLPLWTWVVGVFVLGAAITYGIFRNRTRSRRERIISNEATKELYRQENRSS